MLLQIGAANVLVDPMWSERASPVSFAGPRRFVVPGVDFEELPPIEVVLISHDHYDHLDHATVSRLSRRAPNAQWLVPLGVGALVAKWGAQHVRELDWWDESRMDVAGGVTFACTPAQHFSGRGLRDRGRRLWCSWVIKGAFTVFFAGDTAYHPDFRAIASRYGPFDLVLLPVGAYEPRWFMGRVHMNPDDAMNAYRDLHSSTLPEHATPPALLPIHWGTFRLTDEAMDEPPRLIARLWHEAGYDVQNLWLLQHGETRRRRR